MFDFLAKTFGTIGLIATGSLIGSLIMAIIQYCFEKNKLKTERESLLAREIYFRLQDKAEKVRFGMQLLSRRMNMITLEIKLKIEKGIVSNTEFDNDFIEDRTNLPVYLETYFPEINTTSYNHCVDLIDEMVFIYKDFKDNIGILNKEKIEELNKISDEFSRGMINLSKEIQLRLDHARLNIK